MDKKYSIAGIVGVVALVLIGAYATLYNKDYVDILGANPDQDVFVLKFDERNQIEILTRASPADCDYGLVRISKDEVTIKCGWRIAGKFSSWTEYWRTYGQNNLGEEAWWVRNNRKSSLIKLDYKIDGDRIIVTRSTPFYKGRSSSDGELIEEFLVHADGVKITSIYTPVNDAKHRIIYRVDKSSKFMEVDSNDPYGNFVGMDQDSNGKNLSIYGELSGVIKIDPSFTLVSPTDRSTVDRVGNAISFSATCTTSIADNISNVTIQVFYNRTLGWTNFTATNMSSKESNKTINMTWSAAAAYVDVWPYAWRVECCSNKTIRDHCVYSSTRLLALNVQPALTGVPSINSALRSDEEVTCTLDGSLITATARTGRFSYANNLTNGIVNITWILANNTANKTAIHNVRNLTVTFTRGLYFNISKTDNITCFAQAWDGVQNSSWVNSTSTLVSDGRPWDDLNITVPVDTNAYYENDSTKSFTINWTEPSETDGDSIYYTITLDSPAGTPIYNVSLNQTGGNVSITMNTTANSLTRGHLFNTSVLSAGSYYINLTACDGNHSIYSNRGNCSSDTTHFTIDIIDYTVSFGPSVSTFRIDPPGNASASRLKPIGQDATTGIFKVVLTKVEIVNLTLQTNGTLNSCIRLWCSPNSSSGDVYRNLTYSHEQGWNITNLSQGSMIYRATTLINYIYCFVDYESCTTKGTLSDTLFNFNIYP